MDKKRIFDIVFQGGGAKGLAHVGAMKTFHSLGYESARLVGTSAGAMTAGLLAAGFSAEELGEAASEKLPDGRPVFSGFMDVPKKFSRKVIANSWLNHALKQVGKPFIPGFITRRFDQGVINLLMKSSHCREGFSFIERGGLYAGDALLNWLVEKLDSKGGLGHATFSEFFEKTNTDLSVIASDTTAEKMLILNHRTTPDCPVSWAIRMSMNLPFVWQEVIWDRDWGQHQGMDVVGHAIIDGGMISNFALDLLVSHSPEVHSTMGAPTGNLVFGLLLDGNLPVPDAPPRKSKPEDLLEMEIKHSKTFGRVTRTLDTITGARDLFVQSGYETDVCRLPVGGYGTTEFDMSQERIDALVMAGQTAAGSYFNNRVFS